MFGNMPAYGMYARHVKALSARDVVFTTDTPDARPAFRFEEAAGVDLDRVIVPRGPAPRIFRCAASPISCSGTARGCRTSGCRRPTRRSFDPRQGV